MRKTSPVENIRYSIVSNNTKLSFEIKQFNKSFIGLKKSTKQINQTCRHLLGLLERKVTTSKLIVQFPQFDKITLYNS